MRFILLSSLCAVMASGCAEPAEPARTRAEGGPKRLALALPAEAAAEKEQPVVRKAECRRAEGKIKLDGKITEPAWKKAQVLKNFSVYWQKRPAKTATAARLLWDDDNLYFAAEMEDADVYALVTEANGQTWNDDVFELFFKPSNASHAYYEFQVNAANTPFEMFLPSRGSGGFNRFQKLGRLGLESAVVVRGSLNKWQDRDEGWTVEGRIPWTVFKPTGGRPKPGAVWKFSLCRYDYSKDHEAPDLSSTSPLSRPDFHYYEDFGDLTFVGSSD